MSEATLSPPVIQVVTTRDVPGYGLSVKITVTATLVRAGGREPLVCSRTLEGPTAEMDVLLAASTCITVLACRLQEEKPHD
jgi:hypothetical protein